MMPRLRTILLVISMFTFLISCGGDSETEPEPPSVTCDAVGFETLGRGYDVFDNYADPLNVKSILLDRDAMCEADLFEVIPYERSTFYTASGSNIQEYSQALNHNTQVSGNYMFFSGSAGVNFSERRYTRRAYSFATVQSLIKKHGVRVKLDVPIDRIGQYLNETASVALNNPNVPPEELFRIYGTHVMVGLIVGGRLDYSVSADMTDVDVASRIGMYAEASFKSGFKSASIQTSTEIENNMSHFNETMEKRLEVYGGKSEEGQNIVNDDDYRGWIESVEEKPVFCDFEESGLVPIWEFCNDQSRRNAIETAFNSYAKSMKITTSGKCLIGLDVQNTYGSSNPAPELSNGYKLLNRDLNIGAGGDFIWIYYKLGPDDGSEGEPITGIYTVNTNNGETNPTGGTLIPVDLNDGAGGDYIYLGYFTGTDDPIIRSIAINNRAEKTSTGDFVYSEGGESSYYFWVTQQTTVKMQDLNESAGGHFVYLGYSHDFID